MAQSSGVQGIGSVGGATSANATTQTQAPQAQPTAARTTHEQSSTARDTHDTFNLSDEASEEAGDHRPTPAIGHGADDAAATGETKGADGDKKSREAKEAEEKKKAEEEAKKKEIEELQKKIEELEKKLEEQQKSGDKEGAKQTQAQLDSARQQLKDLTEPQSAGPIQPVKGAGQPAQGNQMQSDPYPANLPASHPYYNQGAPGSATAPGGVNAPGGASAPGTSANPGANARPISAADLAKGTPMGQALAKEALAHATDGTGDGQHCFRNVSDDLKKFGINTSGASAYMAADQLAQSDKLKEVSGVSQDDLKKLPPGAVVVWDRGGNHEHGHISVSLGDGREASDIIRQQTTNYGTAYRVFLPNDG